MSDNLTDQLRRYGAALEEHLDAPSPAVVDLTSRRRRRLVFPAAAAVAAALVVGVTVGALARGDDDATVPVSTNEDHHVATTSTTVASSPSTTVDSSISSVSTTEPRPTTSTPTTTTPNAARSFTGSATWIGRDPRAELRIAACPTTDTARGCPSMVTAPVADDGTFVLYLRGDSPEWRVAAYVATGSSCVFGCVWEKAPSGGVRSEAVTVDARTPTSLSFSVSARVVDVFVRDRNGDPFDGGGVQASDTRCRSDNVCPNDATPMFSQESPTDGTVRLVVDPAITYGFHGQAVNTGWSDPMWTNDGNEFWFSPEETMSGAALDEGHVFYVQGAPTA